MTQSDFYKEVYEIVRQIPMGTVSTYGQVARLAAKPLWSRKVGKALSCVPENLDIPCHRVVNSQGRLAPFWNEQRQLLEAEGVKFRKNGYVDLSIHLWDII